MIRNKLQHCFFGLVVFVIGIVGGLSVSMSPIIKAFFLVLAFAGGFWACVIGHAGMYFFWLLAIPFFVVGYFVIPPVRLKNGKAYDTEYEVIAFSVLSDRIILVREFPIQDTIEGVSIFRPKRMLERTGRRLTRSASLQITLDESKVQKFFGDRLPDMEDLERDRVDSVVGRYEG